MQDVVIVAAKRTAIGAFGGYFARTSAVELGASVLREILPAEIPGGANPAAAIPDEVIVGNILSAGLGQNPARQIAVGAGLPVEVPSYTVNKLCASGLKAVTLAATEIGMGSADLIAAGGTENMTMAPYAVPTARYGARLGNAVMTDLVITDALTDAFRGYHMGVTAEHLARQWGISREEQDAFALRSQQLTEAAAQGGRFAQEIVPIEVPGKKGRPMFIDADEHPRPDTTIEKLATLNPAFETGGTVTAGNASGINDGAAMVLLAGAPRATELGLKPLARIVAWASSGVDPEIMGFGPVPATARALTKAGWSLQDVELAEVNEAFAAQSLAVLRGFEKELGGIDPDIVNVNGGAIALGHPVGASGARIVVTLVHEMARRNVSRGLATLCVGGGQGMALLVER